MSEMGPITRPHHIREMSFSEALALYLCTCHCSASPLLQSTPLAHGGEVIGTTQQRFYFTKEKGETGACNFSFVKYETNFHIKPCMTWACL